MSEKIKTYIKAIIIPLLVGGIVGLLISNQIDYNSLNKPPLAPPSSLFPIMWTVLYFLMGVSYGILDSNNLITKKINNIYYLQLGVNALWPIAFFILKWRLFAFIWILLLVVLICIMIYRFYEKNKTSSYLQIPYLIWTAFASYLSISIYLLNK